MELRQLEYFVAVADEGSINGAAELLHMSQPALSRQIRVLERELKAELLIRTPRGVEMTPAGESLSIHARMILALRAETVDVVAQRRQVEEVINIGVPPGTAQQWLLALVQNLNSKLSCNPILAELSSNQQLKRLREGRLDLCLVHQQPPRDMDSWLLRSEKFGLAIRPGQAIEKLESISPKDLNGLRIMVHSREQVPTQQDSLIASVLSTGAEPEWRFMHFVEHSRAAAEASRSQAVLISQHTASRQLEGWTWRVIENLDVTMRTWLVARKNTRKIVEQAIGIATTLAD